MASNWIVVANKKETKILSSTKTSPTFSLVTTLQNPLGDLKEGELVSDRPGTVRDSAGQGTKNLSGGEDVHKKKAVVDYLKEVRTYLEKEQNDNRFDKLILVAEPGLLGTIRNEFGVKLKKSIALEVKKELNYLSEKELGESLREEVKGTFPLG